jgi:hypothetical protein
LIQTEHILFAESQKKLPFVYEPIRRYLGEVRIASRRESPTDRPSLRLPEIRPLVRQIAMELAERGALSNAERAL